MQSDFLFYTDFHQLPVVMKKYPSMLKLRNVREPEFQGVRQLKTVRIVNKGGDRNIESRNMPAKFAKFSKDFVHTLVNFCVVSATKALKRDVKDSRTFIFRLKHNGVGFSLATFWLISVHGHCSRFFITLLDGRTEIFHSIPKRVND